VASGLTSCRWVARPSRAEAPPTLPDKVVERFGEEMAM
jgi:hypothetical protein